MADPADKIPLEKAREVAKAGATAAVGVQSDRWDDVYLKILHELGHPSNCCEEGLC